ncbi:MAG: VanZ family protein [Bacillus sp. (in: firmicutes)]
MKLLLKFILSILLCLYLVILTKLILFKHGDFTYIMEQFKGNHQYYWQTHNFIPFKTIGFYLFMGDINTNIRMDNLIGNIIGFVPFGFILPLLSRKMTNLKSIAIATFCLSFTYEIFQLVFSLGSFDVDDLILNTLGGIVGYFPVKILCQIIYLKKQRLKHSDKLNV